MTWHVWEWLGMVDSLGCMASLNNKNKTILQFIPQKFIIYIYISFKWPYLKPESPFPRPYLFWISIFFISEYMWKKSMNHSGWKVGLNPWCIRHLMFQSKNTFFVVNSQLPTAYPKCLVYPTPQIFDVWYVWYCPGNTKKNLHDWCERKGAIGYRDWVSKIPMKIGSDLELPLGFQAHFRLAIELPTHAIALWSQGYWGLGYRHRHGFG